MYNMNANDIIIRPVLSEKAYAGIKNKVYTFVVSKDANKIQIRNAVESIFGVKVSKVNTLTVRPKKTIRGRVKGETTGYKKAIVMLTDSSKTIEFFDSMA